MHVSQIIGFCAGIGTTFSFLPQVWRVYTNDCTSRELSVFMMIVHFSGTSLWIGYGICQDDFIIIAFNGITLTLIACIATRYVYCRYLAPTTAQDALPPV